jgi:hypothetical protein
MVSFLDNKALTLEKTVQEREITMTEDKVGMFLASNAKYFPASKLILIKEKLMSADDSKLMVVSSVEYKDPMTFLLISIFLGSLGIDRFMLGDTGMGILKLLTGGLCGILWLIDVVTIQDKAKEKNFQGIMLVL